MAMVYAKKHFMVLNSPYSNSYQPMDLLLAINQLPIGTKYAFILHDKDLDKDEDSKTIHYHIYLEFATRVRFESISNVFLDNLKDYKKELLSDKAVASSNACIRYLMHLDHPQKYQYSEDLVFHNFDDYKWELLKEKQIDFTIEDIIECAKNVKDYLEYLKLCGNVALCHYGIVKDIWNLIKGNEAKKDRREALKKLEDINYNIYGDINE